MTATHQRNNAQAFQVFMGGTFDPIHNGHFHVIQAIVAYLQLSQLTLLPSAYPPHRTMPKANIGQRIDMLKQAIEAQPLEACRLSIDTREQDLSQPSYTYNTLLDIRKTVHKPICLVLGLDALLSFDTWYRFRDILSLCHLIVLNRPGWKKPVQTPKWWQVYNSFSDMVATEAGGLHFIDIAPCEISATLIRQNISQGLPVAGLLPEAVIRYIRDQQLYE